MEVLQAHQLTKFYGPLAALNGMDLGVEAGQILGLLGPNGSGKTTLLASVLDVVRHDGGTYQWFEGRAGGNPRRKIGALLETPNFYPYLNADQNLAIVAGIKGVNVRSFDGLLDLVGLAERRRSPFSSYSLGMKQRLAIAACLVGDPEVLVLDEPTNGLDPEGMIEVRCIIRKIGEQGKTILLASHMLDEVEKVCTHVAIMKRGKCLASGPVGSILGGRPLVELGAAEADMEKLGRMLETCGLVQKVVRQGARFSMELKEGGTGSDLNRLAFGQGLVLEHLVVKARSLEAEFLEITKS
jgi:ABC-2 type transport system ATP-binding protein